MFMRLWELIYAYQDIHLTMEKRESAQPEINSNRRNDFQ